jgi:hypothetical protein
MSNNREILSFEAWAKSQGLPINISNDFILKGCYAHPDTRVAFIAWQAAKEALSVIIPRWQSMETAPKDGRFILAWCDCGRMSQPIVAHWNEEDEFWADWGEEQIDLNMENRLRCWMPLPDALGIGGSNG